MDNLHTWLSQQHFGLRTFQKVQQKLDVLSRDEPQHNRREANIQRSMRSGNC
jgi:hypothetical protein